jgi:hypothetical protein
MRSLSSGGRCPGWKALNNLGRRAGCTDLSRTASQSFHQQSINKNVETVDAKSLKCEERPSSVRARSLKESARYLSHPVCPHASSSLFLSYFLPFLVLLERVFQRLKKGATSERGKRESRKKNVGMLTQR